MINNEEIISLFEYDTSVTSDALVTAEWNLNLPENILKIGNYRYRPNENTSIYKNIINYYDSSDIGNHYTDATDADIVIDGGFTDNNSIQTFTVSKEKENQQYSLEDCFSYFRPRSGINKVRYFQNRYLHNSSEYMGSRPRYYISDKRDIFKYWTSFRTENNIERGIAKNIINNQNYIDDCAPFVIYKEEIPVNRVVIKMQTNTGDINLGPFDNVSENINDPLYGYENQTTPIKWKVQKLVNNYWVDLISFDKSSLRSDGSNIIKSDGYVELAYGIKPPTLYSDTFNLIRYVTSESQLPSFSLTGDAFLVVPYPTLHQSGILYIWNGQEYNTFIPEFGWYLVEKEVEHGSLCTTLVDPLYYIDNSNKIFKR